MRKKNFIRRFFYYFRIISLPVMLCYLILFAILFQNKQQEIQQNAETTTHSLENNYSLVRSNVDQQYDILTGNPRLTIALRDYLSHGQANYTDVILTNSIFTNFLALKNNAPYIQSVYYYLDGFNSVLTSDSGSIISLSQYSDTDWLSSYQNAADNTWIESRTMKSYSYSSAMPVLTYYKKLNMFRGVMIVNLYTGELRNLFASTSFLDKYFLTDSNGDLLLSKSDEDDSFYAANKEQLTRVLQNGGNSVSAWITMDHEKYYIQAVQEKDGVYVLSCLQEKNYYQMLYQLVLQFILLSLVLLLISFFISYTITRKNFQQIDYFIDVFTNAEKGTYNDQKPSFIKDEYDIILNNIVGLFVTQSFLKNQLALKENQQKIAEIRALQLQINPHFLFNTLQTLDFKAIEYTKTPTELNQMIEALSDILKYSLQNPNSMVTMRDEITYLKKYDSIQRLRYAGKYILYYDYEDEILDFPMMRLLLQPLIENSLYHGIKPLPCSGFIKLKIHSYHQMLFIAVIDTGVGMRPADLQALRISVRTASDKNIGLANVNSRLVLRYGPESALHIQSHLGRGTCISFHIPAGIIKKD